MTTPGSDPSQGHRYSLTQRLALVVVPPAAVAALKLVHATCREEIRDEQHVLDIVDHGAHFLAATWHESVTLVAHAQRNTGFHTLTSLSFDGELAARMVERFGMKALRGSSSRGGMRALSELVRSSETVQGVGFTIDGPKGPRRVAKPGISILSARTQVPVVPIAACASKAWRLRSWDRFPVTRPFCRILLEYGSPIAPPASVSRAAIESQRMKIESTLNLLQQRLERELGVDPKL